MKNLYLTAVLLCAAHFAALSQNSYPMETVGSPSSACMVNNYFGWTNNGVLSFTGTAEVQNINPSNNLSASGGGNVFFTNVTGTYFEISGFSPSSAPQSLDITFGMYGYNVSNLSELVLEYSNNGGTTYTALGYKRLFRNYLPPTPWDVMVSDPLPGGINFSNFKIRFRQTSSSQQFRIDDFEANFYYTLPIKLISFSGQQNKSSNHLSWRANSTNEQEYFIVEKSYDGRKFSAVANMKVQGVGDFSYSFTDAANSKVFYRLKLVDVSGKTNYSQIIYLDATKENTGLIQKIYPVPAKEVINTQLWSNKDQQASILLTDVSGKTVVIKNQLLTTGINNCPIDVQKLNAGLYILKIVAGNVAETRPVMIQ